MGEIPIGVKGEVGGKGIKKQTLAQKKETT